MSRNITLEKHSKHKIPPHFWETPLIFGKPFPGPKRVTDMTPKKSLPSSYPLKTYFAKKWSKTAFCGLSSGQTILPQPIWGHSHQLDDRHRNPNINIKEITWLGNQLGGLLQVTRLSWELTEPSLEAFSSGGWRMRAQRLRFKSISQPIFPPFINTLFSMINDACGKQSGPIAKQLKKHVSSWESWEVFDGKREYFSELRGG